MQDVTVGNQILDTRAMLATEREEWRREFINKLEHREGRVKGYEYPRRT